MNTRGEHEGYTFCGNDKLPEARPIEQQLDEFAWCRDGEPYGRVQIFIQCAQMSV